jgi:hypothetical protein
MSRHETSGENSSKPSAKPGIHEAIAAIGNPSSKCTKSHLTPDAYSTPVASPRLILADVVSNNATLNCSDYSDNASSAFLLIMILSANSKKSLH